MAQVPQAPQAPAAPAAPAGRGVVRQRQPDELEPATWMLADGGFAPEQMVRLRSTASADESVITFVNDSAVPVRAIWINFAGHEVEYTVIEARAKRRYRTYLSHPWIMRDANTGARMMLDQRMVVVSNKKDQEVRITSSPVLPWTLANHKHFPEDFKAVTKALLVSHHHVRHGCAKELKATTLQWPMPAEGILYNELPEPCKEPPSAMTFSITASPARQVYPFTVNCGLVNDLAPAICMDLCNPVPIMSHPVHGYYDITPPPEAASSTDCASAPSPLTRVSRMLGWVVDKVVRRTPQAATELQSQDSLSAPSLTGDCLKHMAEFPQHLVIAILKHLAPTNVCQCITKGPSSARPDILPALLTSDPATWPALTPPVEVPAPAAQ